jgi:small subunit ribosomal protein S25e
MGGKKKLTLKQIERMQARRDERKETKPSGSPSQREGKSATGIILPNPRSEKVVNEIKKMKTLTPFAVASRFNLRLSVAKDLLEELEQKGVIQFVSRSRNLKIYRPAD